ncbi:hypothetical protein BGX27_002831, partial [Mortierella sp. AM989]
QARWEVTQALDFTAQVTQSGPVQQDEEIDDEIDVQPEDHVRPRDDDESENEDDVYSEVENDVEHIATAKELATGLITTIDGREQVRHAGTAEAYHLGLNLDHIRHGHMAHFNKNDKPYFIGRDLVIPSLPLQRSISSWIEYSFNNDIPDKVES